MSQSSRFSALALVVAVTAASAAQAQPTNVMGDRQAFLLRRDAPEASTAASPPYDPTDPSLALAFGSTVNGVNLDGIGQLWTPIPTDPGFYAVCTTQRISLTILLTAAHCVTDENTGSVYSPTDAFARFLGPGSTASARTFYSYDIASIQVQADWFGFNNSATEITHDVAILRMAEPLPDWMTTYGLFTGDPVGRETVNVGYGTYGTGVGNENFDSRRRWGTNRVDFIDGGDLFADFDDGSRMWDSNCLAQGICDRGRTTEAGTAEGDSGGPLFINGQIAGITSFGTYYCANAACDPYTADPDRPFDSFGALNAWAPVSANIGFINGAIAAPEPMTIVLTASGLVVMAGFARRRRNQA